MKRSPFRTGGLAAILSLGLTAAALGGCNWESSSASAGADGGASAGVDFGPSRCGDFPWCDESLSPAERTALLLAAMTLDEKLSLLAGDDPFGVLTGTPATGTSDGIPRLGIPPLYMSDGPVGPREGRATAMPAPIALGAAFNPALAREVGEAIANEVRFKGNDLVHAPTVDVLRHPLFGRVFETYGEDPYLAGRLGAGWIRGAQSQGVIANVKHYAAYTQEGQIGIPPVFAAVGGRHLVDAVVDERTLREIYLPPFEVAVREGGVGSVMCAYNFVNGAPACGSRFLLQEVLRDDWGFDGFVLADYFFAPKATAQSLNAGLDLEMPIGVVYAKPLLQAAVHGGQVSRATIDRRVGNILRTLFRFGFFDRAAFPSDDGLIDKPAHAAVAREAAEQGTVLLKNAGVLPLSETAPTSIAVIGEPARTLPSGGGSSAVEPFDFVSPLAAIRARAGAGVEVTFDPGDDAARAANKAAAADVALVFVADRATEGVDKFCLSLDCTLADAPDALLLNALPGGLADIPDSLLDPILTSPLFAPVLDEVFGPVALGSPLLPVSHRDQDGLIEAVAAANPRTVVILETGGPVLTPWRDRVAGLLAAWFPGQEGGPALARVLFGDADPGGRLPVTFPAAEHQTPTAGNPAQYPGLANRAEFTEGVFIGYRWYDEHGVAPAYPFGFGLSYSTFAVDDLQLDADGDSVRVSLRLANTGGRAGWTVPQVYLGLPSPAVRQPPHALRGFDKLWLAPGETRRVAFTLEPRAFSYWDSAHGGWQIAAGCYAVAAGTSSRDLPLRVALTRTPGGWREDGDC